MALTLREKREKLIADAQAILAGENVTPEQRTQVDGMIAEANIIAADIARVETVERMFAEQRSSTRPPLPNPGTPTGAVVSAEERNAAELASFRAYMLGDHRALTAEQRSALRTPQTSISVTAETRDLGITTGSLGGYLTPTLLAPELEIAVKTWGGALNAVRNETTSTGVPMQYPTSNDVNQQSVVLAEGAQVVESDNSFGQVTISVDQFSTKLVKVSRQLLQDSSFNVASFVRDNFAVRAARGVNAAVTNGSSTGNVQSLLTAATAGPTSAHGTSLAYSDFVALYAALEPAYIADASWMMNHATLVYLMGLVDTFGRPLFTTSVNSGVLETILGRPIVINQALPGIGVNNIAVLFGAFSKYLLRNAEQLEVVRLDERYADYGQVAFIGFHRHGGKLIDAGTHPIVSLTQAAT